MGETIYTLCTLLSGLCAYLLLRQYNGSDTRLMLWGGICFVGLGLNNALLVADLVLFPSVDLALWRTGIAVVAMVAMVFGFVWESR